MTLPTRQASLLEVEPGGPMHVSSGQSLDLLSMLVDADRVWEIEPTRFVKQLNPTERRLLRSATETEDPLRGWHDFMRRQGPPARAAAPSGALDIRVTDAVAFAYRRYCESEHSAALHLALPRRDTVGPTPIIPGSHLVGAMRVAWARDRAARQFPLRATDARLLAGRIEARAMVAARLRTDAPRPVHTSRQSEWVVAACPQDGAKYQAHVGPAHSERVADPWKDVLPDLAKACNDFYGERLAAQVHALRADAERAGEGPLSQFVDWGKRALQATREDGAFVLQLGSYIGSEAHPGCGRTGSTKRIPVCLESGGPSTAAIVASARPLGWMLVRDTGAARR